MSQDIREWARANGYPIGDKGRIRKEIVEQYGITHPPVAAPSADGGDPGDDEEPLRIVPDPDGAPESTQSVPAGGEPPAIPPVPERKPQPPPRRGRAVLRKPGDGKKPLPRVSVASIMGAVYSGIGYLCARDPRGVPIARSIDLMAPVSGEILDGLVKGTLVDRLLQPVARAGEKGEQAAALFGFPALTALAVARPELLPVLRPAMRMSIVIALEVSEQPMKKIQARAEKFAERFGQVDVDAMIDAVWADIDVPTAHSPDEDAAVRKARGE